LSPSQTFSASIFWPSAVGWKTKNILFFGNSLTAGYGLDDPSSESFPSLIQARLDSLNLNYKAINAGLSGETTLPYLEEPAFQGA